MKGVDAALLIWLLVIVVIAILIADWLKGVAAQPQQVQRV